MDVVTLKKAVKDAGKYTDQEVSALEALFADSQIVEEGENENGSYIRWENGLQICMGTASADNGIDINTSVGSLFRCGERSWMMPASFVGPTSLSGNFRFGSVHDYIWLTTAQTQTNPIIYHWLSPVTRTTIHAPFLMAVGRWK